MWKFTFTLGDRGHGEVIFAPKQSLLTKEGLHRRRQQQTVFWSGNDVTRTSITLFLQKCHSCLTIFFSELLFYFSNVQYFLQGNKMYFDFKTVFFTSTIWFPFTLTWFDPPHSSVYSACSQSKTLKDGGSGGGWRGWRQRRKKGTNRFDFDSQFSLICQSTKFK